MFTYTAVINAGRLTLQLFDEMWLHKLQPNVITYSVVISTCGKGEMSGRAL